MNTICITGRLTADIEVKQTQTGKAVTSFSVAVKRPHTKDTTDFLNVSAWNQSAEYLGKYAHKGDLIEVIGCLTSRQYEADGKKRTVFEILSEAVSILGGKKQEPQTATKPAQTVPVEAIPTPPPVQGQMQEVDTDEGLPF